MLLAWMPASPALRSNLHAAFSHDDVRVCGRWVSTHMTGLEILEMNLETPAPTRVRPAFILESAIATSFVVISTGYL